MQKKKFISDLIFIQLINFLVKAFWILWIDREIQNILPADAYGQYYSLLGFSILFIILLDAGINNYNSRKVAKDTGFFHRNFVSIMLTKLMLSVVYVAVGFAVAVSLGFSEEDIYILALLLVFQIIASLNLYLRSNIAAHQEFKLDGFLGVLDRLLVIGICSFLLYHSSFQSYLSVPIFISAQIAGVALTFLVALYLNIQKLEGSKLRWSFDLRLFYTILKQAFPYALLIILMGLFTRMDVVMLKTLLPDHLQADAYAKAYRLLDAANMVAMVLSGMLLPLFSRMIKEQQDTSTIVRISAKWLLLPAIPVISLLLIHSQEVLELLYPARYNPELDPVFQLIMISFLGYALIYIYGTLLTAKADLKFLNISAAATALLNIGLNAWLIPAYGAYGASVSTLISQGIFASLCVYRAGAVFKYSLDQKLIIRRIIMVLTLIVIIFGSGQLIEHAGVHILLSVISSIVIYSLSKVFKPAELSQLLNR